MLALHHVHNKKPTELFSEVKNAQKVVFIPGLYRICKGRQKRTPKGTLVKKLHCVFEAENALLTNGSRQSLSGMCSLSYCFVIGRNPEVFHRIHLKSFSSSHTTEECVCVCVCVCVYLQNYSLQFIWMLIKYEAIKCLA